MRLIDADALKKEVDNFQNCYNGWSDTYDKAYIIEAIEKAPTIEAIPIEQYRSDEYTADACYECKRSYTDGYEPQTYVINPQEPTNDDKCFECDDFFTCGGQCNKIEDEPQTDCAWGKSE